MPLISVIMGVYWRQSDTRPLERAVHSILAQSLRDLELIICDDGSGEAAQILLNHLAAEDSRILLLRPGNIITLPQKLNLCLAHSSGHFIARMDDDDFSHVHRLEKQYAYLKKHTEVAFVGCNINRVTKYGKKSSLILPEFPKPENFQFTMPYIHPSLLFRREALEKANGYCERKYCLLCEDYDLLLRLYSLGMQGANLQEILFDYSMAGVEQKRRKYHFRINEAIVRFLRFRELNMLPKALPYVIKPLIVGLLPLSLLNWLRNIYQSQ